MLFLHFMLLQYLKLLKHVLCINDYHCFSNKPDVLLKTVSDAHQSGT